MSWIEPLQFYEDLIRPIVGAPGFVERPWLAERVEAALADPGCRFLLLTGAPGAGKTTFMAWLAGGNPDWPRYFIRRDSKAPLSSGDARSFLFAVGHQLAASQPALFHPEKLEIYVRQEIVELKVGGQAVGIQVDDLRVSPFYQTALRVDQRVAVAAGELVGVSVKRMTLQPRLNDSGVLQYLALIDPAKVLSAENPAGRIVILVNALDELRYQPGSETILDWLVSCPELPSNVRIVVTSRPDTELLAPFRQAQADWLVELSIDPRSPRVRDDLGRSAARLVAQPIVRDGLAEAGTDPQVFAGAAVTAAGGNFQCLSALFRNLQQALQHGSATDIRRALALQDLPVDLADFYAFYVRQVRRAVGETSVEVRGAVRGAGPLEAAYLPAWEGLYQPLLGVLTVTREHLDAARLRARGRLWIEDRWVTGALGRLGQFLQPRGDGVLLYHNSFVDFLTAARTAATHPDCYLDPAEWHRRIVDYYLAAHEKDWSQCDTYGLTYVVDHVVGAGLEGDERRDVLDRILTPAFTDAVLERAGWLHSFVEDLEVLATIEPVRSARLCLDLILDRPPNSLVIQRCLRLLVKLRPVTGRLGASDAPRQRSLDKVVEILSAPSDAAPARLVAQLEQENDARIRDVIALALAETGDAGVAPRLMAMLRQERREVSWAAADALIALNDRSIISELVRWYETVQHKNDPRNAADRQRILYILGWMHAEEAQALKPSAWQARSPKVIGRGVDLTWLLLPAPGDADYLLERLAYVVSGPSERPAELGPWKDEWVQKRLVRALVGLNITAALPNLRRLQTHIPNRPAVKEKSRDAAKRARLSEAVDDAIAELEARN